MSLWSRMHDAIDREGEAFTLGGTEYRGIIQIIDSSRLRAYLDDIEISGLSKPVLLLITASDVPLAVGGTIARDSRTFTVKEVYIHRVRNEQFIKTAVLG